MNNNKSHNVSLIRSIEGKAKRYKGKLTVPLSGFGYGWDRIKGGGQGKQGGIVFENEEIALKLLNELQLYFDKNKITIRKEVYGWVYSKAQSISLSIWCWWRRLRRKFILS